MCSLQIFSVGKNVTFIQSHDTFAFQISYLWRTTRTWVHPIIVRASRNPTVIQLGFRQRIAEVSREERYMYVYERSYKTGSVCSTSALFLTTSRTRGSYHFERMGTRVVDEGKKKLRSLRRFSITHRGIDATWRRGEKRKKRRRAGFYASRGVKMRPPCVRSFAAFLTGAMPRLG